MLHRVLVAGAAVDGEGTERVQHPRLPALFEQLALGHVVDGTAHERADHEGIEKAAVVGSQQQRARTWQMLAAGALQAEVEQEERHQDRPQRPVQDRVHAARQSVLAKGAQACRSLVRLDPL